MRLVRNGSFLALLKLYLYVYICKTCILNTDRVNLLPCSIAFIFNDITHACFLFARGFANVSPHHANAQLTSSRHSTQSKEIFKVNGAPLVNLKKGGQT